MATVKNLTITALGATLVALGLGGAAQAATVTFDENDFPGGPIDDKSFKGVTFDYKVGGVDSTVARISAPFPPTNPRVDNGLALVGEGLVAVNETFTEFREGVLTLDFAAPTPVLSFEFSSTELLSPALTVELFDPTLTSLGVIPVEGSFRGNPPRLGGGQFTYNGALVSRAVVDFEDIVFRPSQRPNFFAIDNITYEPVPDPLTILGSGMALGFGVLMERQYSRKRKKAKQTGA